MARTRYTAEQKAEALALYVEHGAAETARRTGLPEGTVKSWANRNGATNKKLLKTVAATEAKRRSAEERRAVVMERLWEIADRGTEITIDKLDDVDVRDLVGAWTRAIHDAQLLDGRPTERTEQISTSEVEAEIARLERELANA